MFCLPRKQPCLLNVYLCGFSSRYSIYKRSDTTKAFKIDPNNGTITVARALDRETTNWHNVTVEAKETSKENFMTCTAVSCCQLIAHLSLLSRKICPEYIQSRLMTKTLLKAVTPWGSSVDSCHGVPERIQ